MTLSVKEISVKLINALLQHGPFLEISISDLQVIKEKFIKRRFKKGEVLLKGWEPEREIGLLCEGRAVQYNKLSHEHIKLLEPPAFYGISRILITRDSDIIITADQPSLGWALEPAAFFHLIAQYPHIREYFFHLSQKEIAAINRFHEVKEIQSPGKTSPEAVEAALDFIHHNYSRQISLEALASEVGISKFYLSRLFKVHTGLSFKQHLNKRRIKGAKQMMLNRGMNVSQSCYASGFNNLSHFIRVFKRHEHVLPSDYCRRLSDAFQDRS